MAGDLEDIYIICMHPGQGCSRLWRIERIDLLCDLDLFRAIAVAQDRCHLAIKMMVAIGDRPLAQARVALADLLRNFCCMDARPTSKFTIALGLSFLF